jgi:predicted nucleotidyltransferase
LPELAKVLPLRRVVLFGSWATSRATAFSDVDVLVIYSGVPRDDAYKLVRRQLSLRGLEPHVYTEEEAAAIQPTLDRMTRGAIDLMHEPGGE